MGWDFPLDQFWRMTEHAQLRRVEASPNASVSKDAACRGVRHLSNPDMVY